MTDLWKDDADLFALARHELEMRYEQELHWFPPWSLFIIPTVVLAVLSIVDAAPWTSRPSAIGPGPIGRVLPSWLWDRDATAEARFARGALAVLYLVWVAQSFLIQRGFMYAHMAEVFLMFGLILFLPTRGRFRDDLEADSYEDDPEAIDPAGYFSLVTRGYLLVRQGKTAEGVEKLRDPGLTMYRIPPAEVAFNTLEYFVHHEDIRRAQTGWKPRDLAPDDVDLIWKIGRGSGRLPCPSSGYPFVLPALIDRQQKNPYLQRRWSSIVLLHACPDPRAVADPRRDRGAPAQRAFGAPQRRGGRRTVRARPVVTPRPRGRRDPAVGPDRRPRGGHPVGPRRPRVRGRDRQ